MLDYFVQQDCNLTQIGGLLDSKVSSVEVHIWRYVRLHKLGVDNLFGLYASVLKAVVKSDGDTESVKITHFG